MLGTISLHTPTQRAGSIGSAPTDPCRSSIRRAPRLHPIVFSGLSLSRKRDSLVHDCFYNNFGSIFARVTLRIRFACQVIENRFRKKSFNSFENGVIYGVYIYTYRHIIFPARNRRRSLSQYPVLRSVVRGIDLDYGRGY